MNDHTQYPDDGAPKREPILKVPFVPLVVALGLIALYVVELRMPDQGTHLGFRADDLQQGYWPGMFTYMTVHGGWMHVIMNSVGIIAFGAPVARDLTRGLGAVAWLLFFILCGVIAAIGYSLLNMGQTVWVIGASGALFGLIGASTRLLAGPGLLLPIWHPVVLKTSLAWLGATAVLGMFGGAIGGAGAEIAWETHVVGFIAGLILIGPFHALFGLRLPQDPVSGNLS